MVQWQSSRDGKSATGYTEGTSTSYYLTENCGEKNIGWEEVSSLAQAGGESYETIKISWVVIIKLSPVLEGGYRHCCTHHQSSVS